MGDLEVPTRDAYQKLRARIDTYKQHSEDSWNPNSLNTVYDTCRQETAQLHKRWLDSKTCKQPTKCKTSGGGVSAAAKQQHNRNLDPSRDFSEKVLLNITV